MRKILLMLVLVITVNKVFSQSVKFIIPNSNSKFVTSDKIGIAWEISTSDFEKMKDEQFILVKNKKGSEKWDSVTSLTLEQLKQKNYTIDPRNFNEGYYQLGFKEICSKLPFSMTNGFFEVKGIKKNLQDSNAEEELKAPEITFISPKRLDTVKVGQKFKIEWDYKNAEQYEDSVIYLWLNTTAQNKQDVNNYTIRNSIYGLKPIFLKDKIFYWTLPDSTFKDFDKEEGVFILDFDYYNKKKNIFRFDSIVKIRQLIYSPEFKMIGDKFSVDKVMEVGISLKGAFKNTSTLSETNSSTVSGGISLYGERYSSNLLGGKVPFILFSGELNLSSSNSNDTSLTENFGSSILDLKANSLSFAGNFLIRSFLGQSVEFLRHLGFYANMGYSHDDWRTKDTNTLSIRQTGINIWATDFGVEYDIFGQTIDSADKKNNLRLAGFIGFSLRKILGDITIVENNDVFQSTLGNGSTFYFGYQTGLKIEFNDVALTGKFIMFPQSDNKKEIKGFTNGQLVTTFSIKTKLLKGFLNF